MTHASGRELDIGPRHSGPRFDPRRQRTPHPRTGQRANAGQRWNGGRAAVQHDLQHKGGKMSGLQGESGWVFKHAALQYDPCSSWLGAHLRQQRRVRCAECPLACLLPTWRCWAQVASAAKKHYLQSLASRQIHTCTTSRLEQTFCNCCKNKSCFLRSSIS